MTVPKGNFRLKIVVPIFAIFALSTMVLLLILLVFSHSVSRKYVEILNQRRAEAVEGILDSALHDLVSARMTGVPDVVAAKQRVVIDSLRALLRKEGVQGLVVGGNGTALLDTLSKDNRAFLGERLSLPGPFHVEKGFDHMTGLVVTFPAWQWTILLSDPAVPWIFEVGHTELGYLIPAILAMGAAFVGVVVLILRTNLQLPMSALLSDLAEGGVLRATGIGELDTLGEAVNASMAGLREKAGQVELLHDVALSVHGRPRDEAVGTILEKVAAHLGAGYGALALYSKEGEVERVFSTGSAGFPHGARRAEEILRRAGRTPDTPCGGGPCPEGILAFPLPGGDGPSRGVLLFADKEGGFTAGDGALLRAVAADTALSLAKAERLAELDRFRAVIESAFDLVVLVDREGRIVYANPACEALTGYRPAEVQGNGAASLVGVTREGLGFEEIREAARPGAPWKGTLAGIRKDGQPFHTSAVVFRLAEGGPVRHACIQRDVSEERKLYEQLLRSQKLEAMGTLAGGIAHDFNNILAAILGYADLLASGPGEPATVRDYARTIVNAAQQGAELARKLLLSTRKEKAQLHPVELNAVVRESLDLLSRSIPKSVDVTSRLAERLPLVEGDPSQLQQVVVNLAVNARDAMPGGGELTLATDVVRLDGDFPGAPPSRDFVRLSVSDTGCGMDEGTRGQIFDPFFTTKEAGKGTGLGLFVVHSIVTACGGTIQVYSEPGKGTRFSILLPAIEGIPPGDGGRAAAEGGAGGAEDLSGFGTVLVIDDEPNVLEMSSALLASLGYTVLSANDPLEGLAVFRARRGEVRAVILDLIMPRMGGEEVYRRIRRLDPAVKVLLCSGYSPEGYEGIRALLEEGVDGFIPKPFSRKSLGTALRRVLGD
jgi:PAS domain S-box-containing protein